MTRLMKRDGFYIVWPSFLMAALLEMLVFAAADPLELRLGGALSRLSSTAVYSLGFFCFWAVIATACALTLLFARTDAGAVERVA